MGARSTGIKYGKIQLVKTLHLPLDEERWQRLQQAAQERNLTPEELALEAIESIVQQPSRRALYEQAFRVVGKYSSGQGDISERLQNASQQLLDDYISDSELTAFTALDGEPWHE